MARKEWTDKRIEDIVGNLLRAGVGLSAAVVSAGAAVYLFRHGTAKPDYQVFHGEPPELRSVGGVLRAAFSGRGRDIIQLGLLVLIATPVARVAFSIWGFLEERDHMYTVFTVMVLTILLYSLLGSG